MRSFRAVAWDVDGTLVDSEPLHHRALLAGSLRWGVDLSDLPEQQFRGTHMADVWAALRPRMPADLGPADWLAAINAYYIANSGDLKPLPGVVQTVAALAARGIPQVCVSNSNRPVVRANLAALGLSSYLAFAISLDDVSNGKPDPEPYLRVVERLQLQPNEVLAVEDSRTGVASAVAAGMTVALCADLPIERPDLVTRVVDIAEILGWPGLWRSRHEPPVQAPQQGPPARKGDGSTR
jgi:HAD superfamily hydrolase (TIGR01509 family)